MSRALGGCCDAATQSLAVVLRSEDCLESGTCQSLYSGTNYEGQICGIVDPYTDSFILEGHLVMVLHGEVVDDAGDVPATTRMGAALLAMILIALGAYASRHVALHR